MKSKLINKLRKNDKKWLKLYIDTKDKAAREAVKIYNANMDSWKSGHNEWKSRMEQLTARTLTRNEAWIFIIAITGFAIMIWLKH